MKKQVTLVFRSNLREFTNVAHKLGVSELRWKENKDGTVNARFIMESSVVKSFVEAADEFGFDPEETLRNFDSLATSSDASVAAAEGEEPEVEDPEEPEMAPEDEIPAEIGEDITNAEPGNADEGGTPDQSEIGAAIDGAVQQVVGEDPFEGKTGGAFGEAEVSLPKMSKKLGVQGNTLTVDTRPKVVSQPDPAKAGGVGGEIDAQVKAITSKEGIVAPKSFKVPGYKMRIEAGTDRIRVIPKKAGR